MYTHTYIYTLSLQTRLYELLYSRKGHLTEYQKRLAETRPDITTLYKRIKLSLSNFQLELRTLSATLILLYIVKWSETERQRETESSLIALEMG